MPQENEKIKILILDYITKPVEMNYLIRVLDLQFLNERDVA